MVASALAAYSSGGQWTCCITSAPVTKGIPDDPHFIDLRDLWRSWSPHYKSYTHYSLSHQAKRILGVAPPERQCASADALTTMKLLQYYLYCRKYSMPLLHAKIALLQRTRIEPSFAKRFPTFEAGSSLLLCT